MLFSGIGPLPALWRHGFVSHIVHMNEPHSKIATPTNFCRPATPTGSLLFAAPRPERPSDPANPGAGSAAFSPAAPKAGPDKGDGCHCQRGKGRGERAKRDCTSLADGGGEPRKMLPRSSGCGGGEPSLQRERGCVLNLLSQLGILMQCRGRQRHVAASRACARADLGRLRACRIAARDVSSKDRGERVGRKCSGRPEAGAWRTRLFEAKLGPPRRGPSAQGTYICRSAPYLSLAFRAASHLPAAGRAALRWFYHGVGAVARDLCAASLTFALPFTCGNNRFMTAFEAVSASQPRGSSGTVMTAAGFAAEPAAQSHNTRCARECTYTHTPHHTSTRARTHLNASTRVHTHKQIHTCQHAHSHVRRVHARTNARKQASTHAGPAADASPVQLPTPSSPRQLSPVSPP